MKYMKAAFIILTFLVFGYFIAGQLLLPADVMDDKNVCYVLDTDWYWVEEDGTRRQIELPGQCEEEVVLETSLPDPLDPYVTSISFRGEDLKAYVDGELRQEYTTENTRWFGHKSPESYVMIPVSAEDAGKTLRIEMQTDTRILYQVYMGSSLGLWIHILNLYKGEIAVAALTLILGLITFVASIVLGIIHRKGYDLVYLGCGSIFAAIWLIVNSVFRQILFPNISVTAELPFYMVMLLPLPFMIYMNSVQKNRYQKAYTVFCICAISYTLLCSGLHMAGIRDLYKTFPIVAGGCLLCILFIFATIIMDIRKKHIKEYYFVALGILGAIISATVQLVTYFGRKEIFSGSVLAIGLIILLVCSVINTVKNIFTIEQEKRAAVLANEAKGQFLASMSHEIRTPINAVIGMDEMILRETTDKNIRGYAMDIQSAGQSLLSLINDILDLSKIESGKMEIISIEYDFSSLIHDIVNMIRIKAENKELQVNLFVESSIPSRLFGDDVRIRQILINLLNNAVKYTQEGSVTLSVTGTQEKDTVMLHFSVKDTGIGIKAEDLPKLTEKFGRIEEKRNREIEGTGLGLHITGQLLQLMNSKLNVESVYGEGSCFSFDLLQKIVDYEPIGNLEERIRNQESSYMYNASFMAPEAEILVVDDSAVNRKVFVNLLKETKLRIDQADGGMSCLEMTENKKYDLIFLDHMMPDLDGIETLHRMKASEHNLCADTPIIALTANAIIGAKEMYLAEGFDDFLTKPVASGKLEKMILKYLPEEKVQECGNGSEEPVMSDSENDSVKELLSQIPDINLEYALLLNGTSEHVYEGMMDFIELADAEADELETFFESIDMPEGLERYRIKVHAMKSSAAVIGAMQLSGLARALEMAAKDERNEDIRNVTPVFLREWRKCKETVSTVLCKQEREAEDKAEFHKELFLGQMDMLADALTEMDIDTADQIVEMLKQYRYPDSISESMKQIYTAEKELDADKVILLYAAIKEQL